jgi:hypothetical protein
MCGADEESGFRSGSWVRARKAHRCYACRETIRPGDLYHREAGTHEGDFFLYKHCARCWKMLDFVLHVGDGTVQYDLNCGEDYEYEGNEADPAHQLAFLTQDEAQTHAEEVLRQNAEKRANGWTVYE